MLAHCIALFDFVRLTMTTTLGCLGAFLVVLALSSTTTTAYELEEEAELISTTTPKAVVNKKYHVFSSKKVSWEDANGECKAKNMTFAAINNKAEQNELIRTIRASKKPLSAYWTSGTVKESSEYYYWKSTGDQLSFSTWREGEPNPFGEFRCILINSGGQEKWMFFKCSTKEFFACQE